MTQSPQKPHSGSKPASALGRQLIISAVALGIIGAGAWSMWSQSAPYHPQIAPETVTRGDAPALSDTSAGD